MCVECDTRTVSVPVKSADVCDTSESVKVKDCESAGVVVVGILVVAVEIVETLVVVKVVVFLVVIADVDVVRKGGLLSQVTRSSSWSGVPVRIRAF